MMIIGVDPHKSTHTATAVDPHTNRAIASIHIQASLADYARMLRWARQFDQRRWAVENAEGLRRHLSSWLLARGEQIVDVPTTCDRQSATAVPRRWPQERPDRRRGSGQRGRAARRRPSTAGRGHQRRPGAA